MAHGEPNPVLWQPSPSRVARAAMTAFRESFAAATGRTLPDYAALHRASIEDGTGFWQYLLDWSGLLVTGDPVPTATGAGGMPEVRYFPALRLNMAENLLTLASVPGDTPALIALTEEGRRTAWTFADLARTSAAFAAWLAESGVGPGDRVAAIMPNTAETVIAMLGAARLGAIFSSCASEFGAEAISERFRQIKPKIIVAAKAYGYGGKRHDCSEKIKSVAAALPTLAHIALVAEEEDGGSAAIAAGTASAPVSLFADILAAFDGADPGFRAMGFNDPLYVLYSSGTTGVPKPIVHGIGGTLLQHIKEHRLHCDIRPGDAVFYFTTCGWMMWNWLVSALASGATLILYDGSPFYPRPSQLFDIVQREGVTLFGVGAKYLDAVMDAGVNPGRSHDLSALRTICSTGSPLAPHRFDDVYRRIKADIHLASISGGTDIVSCFVLGDPAGPVRRGEIQVAGLGMAVEIFNRAGAPVRDGPGELVCTRPFPSMPLGFWGDDGARYRAAYFERFPGVWHHGDWIERCSSGGYIISGRSDATLNPGGVRIGTAEIYRPVEKLDEITEAVAVAQQWQGDVRIVLFVTLAPGHAFDDALVAKIRAAIRREASPRHVPAVVLEAPDIPRTRSGKIAELAVRDAIHARASVNLSALANPDCLDFYRAAAAAGGPLAPAP